MSSVQSTLKAQQELHAHQENVRKAQEEKEKEEVACEGGNPEEVVVKRSRLAQWQKEKE